MNSTKEMPISPEKFDEQENLSKEHNISYKPEFQGENTYSHRFTDMREKLGFSVIPIGMNKIPIGVWKRYQTEYASPEELQNWDKSKHNIGIVTGKLSGVFVVDIDIGERLEKDGSTLKIGDKTFADLEAKYGEIPPTVEARSVNGGRHLYFKYPEHYTVKNLAGKDGFNRKLTDIDIRGDGGYIVAPPSKINGKSYEWVNSPYEHEIKPAPYWLLNLINKENTMNKAYIMKIVDNEILDLTSTSEGSRNEALNKTAYKLGTFLHTGHISRNEIEGRLISAGEQIRLDKKEAYNTIKSGLDAGELKPRTNISSQNTHEYISENKKTKPIKIESFCVGHFLNDSSPMPEDIISKRLLTESGILVIAGAPKVGKSDFVLHLLYHMAGGLPFLDFTPPKPLKIFYLQAEVQYPYMRERIKTIPMPDEAIENIKQNLLITQQTKMILSEDGVNAVIAHIKEKLGDEPPDIIVIDPIRNLFDGGTGNATENDNTAMIDFLQNRVDVIRDEINPKAGVILVHHTKKMVKREIAEDPFLALSGASSLRGYYTSGIVIYKPSEKDVCRNLAFELRNGKPIADKLITKQDEKWIELDPSSYRLANKEYGEKLDAERERKQDVILQFIEDEALEGKAYTRTQFAEKFENNSGLSSKSSILNRLNVLETKGYIKFFQNYEDYNLLSAERSKFGYMCIENMELKVGDDFKHVLPTHYKCSENGLTLPIDDENTWIYHDDKS